MSSAAEHARRLKQRSRLEHCASCERRERKLTSHLTRFRDKSRITARASPCPQSSFCAKQEELVGIDAPNGDIALNTTVPIGVELANHALSITSWDPDGCDHSKNACSQSGTTRGYCVTIVADFSWGGSREHRICHNKAFDPPNVGVFDMNLPGAPSSGTGTVSVHLELRGGGTTERTAAVSQNVSFSETGSTNPGDTNGGSNGDNGDNGGGPFLPCLLDPNRSCDSVADSILQGGALLLLLVVLIGQAAPG